MKKPCDDCTVNLEQAMFYDEVTCFKTCVAWQRWRTIAKDIGGGNNASSFRTTT